MKSLYILQLFVYSLLINCFILFTILVHYSDLLLSPYLSEIQEEYDYVIVGSGTAGSLIAHRLATETNFTFIVLEAGGRSHSLLEIPVLGPLLHGTLFDWQYTTVPQKNACFAMNDNKCRLPQGKIIGGSTMLNNMIHIRGNISHYIEWFHHKYNEEFIKEHLEYIENEILNLEDMKYESLLSNAILESAKELGYNVLDLNEKFEKGFMKSVVTQKNGKRWSPHKNIESKYIVTNALVEKVLINEKNNAYSVKVDHSGMAVEIRARKGVVLTAGSLNTPKILQLSGIGPKEILRKLNITIIKDLPVGKNLQDHIATGLDLLVFEKPLNIGPSYMLNPYHIYDYFFKGVGPFTNPGCEVVGFLSTKNSSVPDIQFMVLPVGISAERGSRLRTNIGLKSEVWNDYFTKTFDKYTATILPILLHPKSRGVVHISSTNPKDKPFINPKYLSVKSDVDDLVDALKLLSIFLNTKPIKELEGKLNSLHFPGCENYVLFSDPYLECYVKKLTLTSFHPVGTCSMGLPDKNTSVVDTSFKVIGVNRLYIADGSVLPTLPSGNINAAVALMASIFFDINIKKKDVSLNNFVCYVYDVKYELFNGLCVR